MKFLATPNASSILKFVSIYCIGEVHNDKSSPFCVKYYTFKVEFQQRGAAHIHGTLWLDTRKLEQVVNVNGHLQVKGMKMIIIQ